MDIGMVAHGESVRKNSFPMLHLLTRLHSHVPDISAGNGWRVPPTACPPAADHQAWRTARFIPIPIHKMPDEIDGFPAGTTGSPNITALPTITAPPGGKTQGFMARYALALGLALPASNHHDAVPRSI